MGNATLSQYIKLAWATQDRQVTNITSTDVESNGPFRRECIKDSCRFPVIFQIEEILKYIQKISDGCASYPKYVRTYRCKKGPEYNSTPDHHH